MVSVQAGLVSEQSGGAAGASPILSLTRYMYHPGELAVRMESILILMGQCGITVSIQSFIHIYLNVYPSPGGKITKTKMKNMVFRIPAYKRLLGPGMA